VTKPGLKPKALCIKLHTLSFLFLSVVQGQHGAWNFAPPFGFNPFPVHILLHFIICLTLLLPSGNFGGGFGKVTLIDYTEKPMTLIKENRNVGIAQKAWFTPCIFSLTLENNTNG
jgi:hypothetical protein